MPRYGRGSAGIGWFLAAALAGPAFGGTLARLERPAFNELQKTGFTLERDARVEVDAVGMAGERTTGVWNWWSDGAGRALAVRAWLLDADTRRAVWELGRDNSDPLSGDGYLREAKESIELPAGRYELYLHAALPQFRADDEDEGRQGIWERLLSSASSRPTRREAEIDLASCGVTLKVPGDAASLARPFEVTGELDGALIRLAPVDDSRFETAGFALSRPQTLRVYSVFEHPRGDDTPADYGWIVDADRREVVWTSARSRNEAGGGGEKNRRVDEKVSLPAGRYIVHFGTDDSHAANRFNVPAPVDPLNWGLTLLPGDGFDRPAFSRFEPDDAPAWIVIDKVGNGRYEQRGFELTRETELQVLALGEGDEDSLYDHAWITDAEDRVVWSMTPSNTVGAGGAEKNRRFDGLVRLPAGLYRVHYATDDSHAYDGWNAARPFQPEAWGVRLSPGPGASAEDFRVLSEAELDRADRDTLARVTGVGDDERRSARFTLDRPTSVRIRALGEGVGGEMADYGWLVETGSGRRVWEMRYDRTVGGGGASKNRAIEETIELPAGTYEVFFVTDGSHAFGDWNASPPDQPSSWGIVVRRAG